MPYISPSEQKLIDERLAEEERIRLLLAADNFRELALIEMMDGVLEVRWEDELKKEIEKPDCMVCICCHFCAKINFSSKKKIIEKL